jgi:hypothetical protein
LLDGIAVVTSPELAKACCRAAQNLSRACHSSFLENGAALTAPLSR